MKKIFMLLKILYKRLLEDEIAALSAQVTYYIILAFFPFLIFLVSLLSYTAISDSESFSYLAALVPESVYSLVNQVVNDVISSRGLAFMSFGMLATLWSASTGARAFIHGINKAYKIKENRPFWKTRLISIFFIFALSMIIVFSFVLVVFGEIVGNLVFEYIGFGFVFERLWDFIRFLLALGTLLLVFVLFYFYAPNRKLKLREVLPGALLSTFGWIAISVAFSFYVNNFRSFSNTYGSLGAIMALLIWLYWSSIIILTGGELNAILIEEKEEAK